jgi:hypothetical protein
MFPLSISQNFPTLVTPLHVLSLEFFMSFSSSPISSLIRCVIKGDVCPLSKQLSLVILLQSMSINLKCTDLLAPNFHRPMRQNSLHLKRAALFGLEFARK